VYNKQQQHQQLVELPSISPNQSPVGDDHKANDEPQFFIERADDGANQPPFDLGGDNFANNQPSGPGDTGGGEIEI